MVNKDRRRRHAQQLPKATIMAANFYGRRSAKRRKTTDLSNDLRRAEDSRSEFSDLDLSDEDDSVGNDCVDHGPLGCDGIEEEALDTRGSGNMFTFDGLQDRTNVTPRSTSSPSIMKVLC